jgi:GNAT superfamily N-acetyltransferase
MTTLTRAPAPAAIEGTGITFRMWRGLGEIPAMAAANNALRERCGVLEAINVEGMRHRYTHLVNSDPAEDCLVIERDGITQGYARMEWHDLADGDRIYEATLLVSPAVWGHGVGEAAVRWLEARASEMAAAHPTSRTEHIGHYLFGGDLEGEAAMAALGYAPVRREAEMLRPDLEDLPTEVVPEGYEIRTPEEDELAAVHAMYVAAFHEHWGQYEEQDQRLEEWVDSPHFRRDLQVVVFRGDEPAAGASNQLHTLRDGRPYGYLDGVATHPDHRRRGLARAAVARSLRMLRDAGATAAALGVDQQNHNHAMALYESSGFRLASTGTQYRKTVPPRGATS